MIAAAARYDYSEDSDEVRFERAFFGLSPDGDAELWEDAPDPGEDP